MLALALAPASLMAAPIAVNHHSFESADFGGNTWTNNLESTEGGTQWVGRDGNGSGDAFLEVIPGFAADGGNHVGMATGYYLTQDTGVAWEAHKRYRLTVAVGNRNASFTNDTNGSVIGLSNDPAPASANTAGLLADDAILAAASTTYSAFNLAESQFGDVTATFDTGETPPTGTIVVVIGDNSGSGRSHFDNIRLTVTDIPVVSLHASGLDAGAIVSWENTGSLGGTFEASGDPEVKPVDQVHAVHLDGDEDWFVGPIAPDAVAGSNPRTIEAWIHNFTIDNEETVFAWGRRGGPEGSNVSFNHGSSTDFGAVGHWGGPDIGWNGRQEPDIWTHVAYTHDGSESRVYVNGILADSEASVLNSHTLANDNETPLPFVVGNQNDGDGTQSNGLSGSLSISSIQVYAAALSGDDIHANYNASAAGYGRESFQFGGDKDGDNLPDEVEMAMFGNLAQDGAGDLDGDGLSNADEAANGTNLRHPDTDNDGVDDATEVAGGSDPTDPASVPQAEAAALVVLDAADLEAGAISAWTNDGSLGGSFAASGDPMVEEIAGAKGVTLDGEGDWLIGPASVPSIEGASARTIEAWVYNPEIASEETVVSWGRRGGPDGSNVSFNHGSHPDFGAVGHWGGPDIGWGEDQEQGIWSHIVYTNDGSETRVYTNGELSENEEGITLNSHAGFPIVVGAQWEGDGVTINEALSGSLSVGLVRIYDGALSDEEVAGVYNEKASAYGRVPVPIVVLDSRDFPGEGPLSGWTNTGSLGGNFASEGDPQIADVDGVRAVTLDGEGDWLVGPIAPDSVTGPRPRAIEAWVYNPEIADEETVFSWGRRGGPDGSNVSFNHGANATFGAVGHWGAPDIGWNGDQEAAMWTHITYSNDGSETRVYTNGLLSDSEAFTPATHAFADDGETPLPFLVGNQSEGDGTQVDNLSGSMSIALIRVFDAGLSDASVAHLYNENAASFGRDTFIFGGDSDEDGLTDDYELATFGNLDQTGEGDPDEDGLTNADEAGRGTNPLAADSDNDGASDKEEVDAGTDPLSPASVPEKPVRLLVELQSGGLDDGPLATWTNTGELTGDFVASGDPTVETIDGAKGVTLDGDGDWLVGPVADPGIEGASARSITAWIYNPVVAPEETIVSWGRRGGPDGTNVSFNHGTHNAYGAVGHWGNGPDIGWDPSATADDADTGEGQEEAGIWTFVAYTQDGSTTSVYTNGALTTSEEGITLNTHSGFPILVGSQWEGDGVTPNAGLAGSLSIGELRIYDGALSAEEIASQFDLAAAAYGRAGGGDDSIAGLVGLWRFDDGTAADSSGNGNDGTLENGASVAEDSPYDGGHSLFVDGGEQHVLVPHHDSLNAADGITIAAWVKPMGDMEWDGILAKNPSDDSATNHAGNYELRIENGSRGIHFLHQQGGADDTAFYLSDTTPVAGDVWSHIAVSGAKGGDLKFYINGAEVFTWAEPLADTFGTPNANPLYIGSRADLFTAMNGYLDDVALFNRALSAEEIGQIMIGNFSGVAPAAGLKAGPHGSIADTIALNPLVTFDSESQAASLSWEGLEDGVSYAIEFSTSLAPEDWKSIGTVEAANGAASFVDTERPTTQGFYRIRQTNFVD